MVVVEGLVHGLLIFFQTTVHSSLAGNDKDIFNPYSNSQSSTTIDSSQVSVHQNFLTLKTQNFRKNHNFTSQVQSSNAYSNNDQTQKKKNK